jgi:hypothetical protein
MPNTGFVLLVAIAVVACSGYRVESYYSEYARCAPVEPPEASEPHESREPSDAEAPLCLDVPEVKEYLDGIYRQIYREWRLPRGRGGDRSVQLVFVVSSDGSISCMNLPGKMVGRFDRSVVAAFKSVGRFDPIPEEAECLVNKRFVGKFRSSLVR